MPQADTFDPKRIDTELGWAAGIGMNTMRVFLDDLLWQQDADRFKKRLLEFLGIADSAHQDDVRAVRSGVGIGIRRAGSACPNPASTTLVAPESWRQGVSGPEGVRAPRAYVKGVVRLPGEGSRVLAWDLWNEPDNMNGSSYNAQEPATRWSSC